jgi:type IV pilus assembly protein PilM
MDPGIVSDAIRAALDNAGVNGKHIVTAVGGRDVMVKKIQTERVKEKQARELMRWEAEQHVPDVESVELDFQILEDAGVTPSVVDVDAFALHNAFEVNYPEAMKGFVGLVNVGNEVTNVNIMDNGVPVLTRDLPLGTRRFSEDLQRQHGMSARDSENMIRGYDRSPQLDSILSMRVEEIAMGVERAAAFLTTSRNAAHLRAVYVCGGGSRTPGLAEMLGDRLKIKVEHANPLARLNIRDGALESLTTDEVAPLLMLPIGLALRQ